MKILEKSLEISWLDREPQLKNGYLPEKKLTDSDLKVIKKSMDKLIRADMPIRREEVSREEAKSRIYNEIRDNISCSALFVL